MSSTLTSVRRLPVPVLASFILLALMVIGGIAVTLRLTDNTRIIGETSEYRHAITDVVSGVREAETGQRGYLLTADDRYLDPYRESSRIIGPALDRIGASTDRHGQGTASALRPLVAAKLAELRETIEFERTGHHGDAIATVRSDRGRSLMDRIRVIASRERDWAIAQADDRNRESRALVRVLLGGLIVGALAVVLLSLAWLRQARRQFAALNAARADAEGSLVALKIQNVAREEAEGRVRMLQKMESLGQLTGGIAHDFNNMLAVVLGGIELAKRRLRADPERAEASLEHAREGATRAVTLTSRLLAFSRNQPLAPSPLDANKLIGGICEMLGRTLGEQIEVECVYGAGLWRCYADPSEVENALLNLSINARDAMPGGGKLTVETANAHIDDEYARTRPDVTSGQFVLLSVSDTGHGMPADVVDRAFDPFFTTKAVGKGTGLGLSQVFGFAKQSGGHVAIYSEIGQGTTVKIYLPRFAGAEPAVTGSATTDNIPEGRAEEVVLVVEDEQRVRHFAVDALRELGYTAISASDPIEALKSLREQPRIDMMFTDIVMPEMTGRQLADAALELRPDLRVLYTTGYTRNAVVHNGMIDIGVAFLPKPYSLAELARKVRDVLDGGGINRPV